MHLSRILTEGKKIYFVEQPFLADYLFRQKTGFVDHLSAASSK